ncbi:hypothetical protein BH20ACT24_BH20ACT24_17990 [soil metagenome]
MTIEGARTRSGPLRASAGPRVARTGRKVALVTVLSIGLLALGGLGLFKAVRTEPTPPTALLRAAAPALARPVVDGGSLAELIADLQARLQAVPEDWESYASLGLAYVQQARITADPSYYPRAEAALDRSLSLHASNNVSAMIGMGTLALARHEFDEALAWGERARDTNATVPAVHGVVGDALIELGRYPEAFAALQQMVDLRPDLSSYARASYARELQGDVEGALAIMRQAFDSAGSRADTAWTLHQLGELYFNSGSLDLAEQHYRRAISADETFVPAKAGVAKVAAARGRMDAAIDSYAEIVQTYPLPEYVIALADLYTATGRTSEAELQFALLEAEETLLRANGVNVDLEFALFSADHRIDLEAGLAAAEGEWARRKSVHVADALAWQLYAHERFPEALRMSEEALRLGTESALFLFHRGMIEHALGNDDDARRDLARAIEINPHFSVLWAKDAADTLSGLRS